MPAVPEPLVSVVVSTYNRPARLARLLAALREQTLAPDQFEVIIVDNGSEAATAAVLQSERARGGLELVLARNDVTRGPAGGRNTGWRLARAPLVAFTDDDCAPATEWLSAALALAALYPGAIIQGATQPDPDDAAAAGPFSHTVTIERLGPRFETCNIFYWRSLLERLGGFDERFGLEPAGEDTDLAWRAIDAGAEAVFAPDAVVHHAVERLGMAGSLRTAARWSAVVRVFDAHPGTRSILYRGVFWNVWHYLLWRSLLALAGPRWLRWMLLARHGAALRRRAAEQGAGSGAIAFLVVYDAVECWAIARGAIRFRTLVL
jgi:GT2 family glycosyltransferase